jgi:hypothetical protein
MWFRYTRANEWLAFVEASGEYNLIDMRSEFSGGGEAYVLIERARFAEQIDAAYEATIGVYLREEKTRRERERQRATLEANQTREQRRREARLAELMEALRDAVSSSEEESDEAGSLQDFIVDSEPEEATHQRQIHSSPEPDESAAGASEEGAANRLPTPPRFAYQDAAGSLTAMQRDAALEARQQRRDPDETPPEDTRPDSARRRFSKTRNILRFRVDGLGRTADKEQIVFE